MEKTINGLPEYIGEVKRVDNTLCRNGCDFNERLLFRGQASEKYELIPSIGRNRAFASSISIQDQERNLIEMAKYRMPEIFKNDLLPIELLALLQHYGIPTRLLDLTEDALVALYFACNEGNQNGEGCSGRLRLGRIRQSISQSDKKHNRH